MEKKIDLIKNHIKENITNDEIEYEHSGLLNKFKITRQGHSLWIYIRDELVDDSDEETLLIIFKKYHVVETFNKLKVSKYFNLNENGLKEVDDKFALR
ncbi:hypothetical protein ACFL2X_03085 [Candidatus Latescibacterota bacterium]